MYDQSKSPCNLLAVTALAVTVPAKYPLANMLDVDPILYVLSAEGIMLVGTDWRKAGSTLSYGAHYPFSSQLLKGNLDFTARVDLNPPPDRVSTVITQ